MRFRVIPFVQNHRRIVRVMRRVPVLDDLLSRAVWWELNRDPRFRALMERSQ